MQWSRLEVTVYGPDQQRVFHLAGTAGAETADVGAPERMALVADAAPDSPLARSIAALRANRERPYYDEAADAAARDAYYADVPPDADGATRFRALNELLRRTHTTELSYNEARYEHLYVWVDLQENRMLRSIYTGDEYPPYKVIQEDLRLEAERIERLRGWMASGAASARALTFSDVEAQLAAVAKELAYNCEHVVPQDWFEPRSAPMKSDLHHLFTCDPKCNNYRANIPFGQTGLQGERCGRKAGNEFEPANGKGAAARATLYFFLRYPGEINNQPNEYTADDIATLLQWHRDEPVSRFELHRNAAVQEAQGNRNPLIDHPDWADRIDFTLGLG